MEVRIRRNQVYIEHSQRVGVSECISGLYQFEPLFRNIADEQKKIVRQHIAVERFLLRTLSKLNDLEDLLVERQQIICSPFKSRSVREQLEQRIRWKAEELQFPGLVSDVKVGLEKIFREDRCCASWLSYLWSGDNRRNGGLMWWYLENWRKMARDGHYDKVSSSLTMFSALRRSLHCVCLQLLQIPPWN